MLVCSVYCTILMYLIHHLEKKLLNGLNLSIIPLTVEPSISFAILFALPNLSHLVYAIVLVEVKAIPMATKTNDRSSNLSIAIIPKMIHEAGHI